MPDWELPSLVTPFRFGIVEDGLYRGAYPTLKNWRFLRRLQLRSIVTLSAEAPTADLSDFCRNEQIRLWHWQTEKFEDVPTLTPSKVATILHCIVDVQNHPLFIHCRDGGHNTGLVIMCLRRLQNWNLSVIFSEFCRYVKGGEIRLSESQYVESFKGEVTLPADRPVWLWGGRCITRHPYLRLRYSNGASKDGAEVQRDATSQGRAVAGAKQVVKVSAPGDATVPRQQSAVSTGCDTNRQDTDDRREGADARAVISVSGALGTTTVDELHEHRMDSSTLVDRAPLIAAVAEMSSLQQNSDTVQDAGWSRTTDLLTAMTPASTQSEMAVRQRSPDSRLSDHVTAVGESSSWPLAKVAQWPPRTTEWEHILSRLVFGNRSMELFVDIVDSASLRRLLRLPRPWNRDLEEGERREHAVRAPSKLPSRRARPEPRGWRNLIFRTSSHDSVRSGYSLTLQALALDSMN
ncbi:hypothetical protein CCYA_CCYA20G4771 [Cyanidiococcus yangmingshanensis]|nr:hypothetical protein CCYA_CCYA20G4771 [Cyanidiococcus yangmingshanensis]